jgi:hypothetical protein
VPDGGAKDDKYFQFTAVKFGPRPPRRGFFDSRKTKSNMNNFVTYETALRLRAAGFPQPKPEAGQVWYDPYKTEMVITFVDEWHVNLVPLTEEVNFTEEYQRRHFPVPYLFAPGPAEILRELPDHVCGNNKSPQGGYWCGRIASVSASFHENLAEACAAEWLQIHNKNNNK